MEISNRLKEFRQRTKIKMPAIAEATGINKETLYKWEKGTKPTNLERYYKIVAYLDEMDRRFSDHSEDSSTERKEEVKPSFNSLLTGVYLSQDTETIVLCDGSGVPGNIIIVNEEPVLIVRRNDCSIIGIVDGLVQVINGGLYQRYTRGSWIAVRKLKFIHLINDGYYYYVIDKNLQPIVGKARHSATDSHITLYGESEEDGCINRNIDDILAVFSIEGVIIK